MLGALIPSLLPIIGDVIGRFLPEDKEAAAKAKQEIEQQSISKLLEIQELAKELGENKSNAN